MHLLPGLHLRGHQPQQLHRQLQQGRQGEDGQGWHHTVSITVSKRFLNFESICFCFIQVGNASNTSLVCSRRPSPNIMNFFYKEALKIANLTTLEVRREKMCLKFAKDCLKIDKLKQMFPSNSKDHDMENRNTKKFKVNHAKTERYLKSSIPFLQRLLNTQ